jgi:hypothetical protein
LDTIYRHRNQVDKENNDDDDDTEVEKESTKINEYLTYNWLENFDYFN